MKKRNKFIIIIIAIVGILVGLFISSIFREDNKETVNVPETLEIDKTEGTGNGTTIIAAEGGTAKEWEELVRQKLIETYAIQPEADFQFDYPNVEKTPMGDEIYTVIVEEKSYEINVPGPDAFMFDQEGKTITASDSPSQDDLKQNITISPKE